MLVRIKADGKRRLALVGLKKAVGISAPTAPGAEMPTDPAARVGAGVRALSQNLGEHMLLFYLLGNPGGASTMPEQDARPTRRSMSRDRAATSDKTDASVPSEEARKRSLPEPVSQEAADLPDQVMADARATSPASFGL
ncbi:hypothetical protein ACQKJ1_25955 [Methylorubrum rhodesianum]|uniref:hypothetical protein n=1 Tax=Methylorubrum rhodesianum TaxID=29427 RepID=UPI003D00B04C